MNTTTSEPLDAVAFCTISPTPSSVYKEAEDHLPGFSFLCHVYAIMLFFAIPYCTAVFAPSLRFSCQSGIFSHQTGNAEIDAILTAE